MTENAALQQYKPSEIGPVPQDWSVRRIGELAVVSSGGTPRRDVQEYWGGSIPWVTTSQIDFGLIREAQQFITEAGLRNSAAKLLPAGTLLMALYGQGKTRGKVGLLGISAATNQACASIVPDRRISSEFLLYFLASRYDAIRSSSNVGGQENLSGQIVKSLPVAVPDPLEQEAVVNALSDVDGLLAQLDALLAKKRDVKEAAVQSLVNGRIRLPEFTGNWATRPLGDLFTFSGGYSASRDQLSDRGYCYLHYGDIHLSSRSFVDIDADFADLPKLDVPLNDVSAKTLLKDGDVVFVDASEDDDGTSKHVVICNAEGHPYISGLHTIVARSRGDHLDALFKRYCFQTERVREQFRFFAVGTKVSGISKSNIAKIELSFPVSIAEQRAIASVLSDMDAELDVLKLRRDKAQQLKTGMMQALVTGRIRLK